MMMMMPMMRTGTMMMVLNIMVSANSLLCQAQSSLLHSWDTHFMPMIAFYGRPSDTIRKHRKL